MTSNSNNNNSSGKPQNHDLLLIHNKIDNAKKELDSKIEQRFNHLDGKIDQKFNHLDGKIDQNFMNMNEHLINILKEMGRVQEKTGFVKGGVRIGAWFIGLFITGLGIYESYRFGVEKQTVGTKAI
jgi:hypothetical protein